jgi:hypothetical protein
MMLSKEFYALNLAFAQRVSQVGTIPIEQALLHYTNLYIRFQLGHSLDPNDQVWQEFLQGYSTAKDKADWTYHFAVFRQSFAQLHVSEPAFGCFSYTMLESGRVRLHFHNEERQDVSPLHVQCKQTRLDELQEMFTYIRKNENSAKSVIGCSWLYHLQAYRRLFPDKFIGSAQPGQGDYAYMTLWGQFLNRHGQVREAQKHIFLENLERRTTLEEVLNSFPMNVLYLEAALDSFYPLYGIR